MFGVELEHPEFPGNVARFRIPECRFSGLLPDAATADTRDATPAPYRRYPFMILGPFRYGWAPWEQRAEGVWVGRVDVAGW